MIPTTNGRGAHQWAYSFLVVAWYISYPNGIPNMFDVNIGCDAHYAHQHLPHLSTMCTTGGFFLSKRKEHS